MDNMDFKQLCAANYRAEVAEAEVARLKAERDKLTWEKADLQGYLRLTLAERDALKAELMESQRVYFADTQALAKTRDSLRAELAEAKEALSGSWAEHADVRNQLIELRNRIEALADEMGRYAKLDTMSVSGLWEPRLRALLQPVKEETALDVLAELEAIPRSNADAAKLAKLRALLEKSNG